MTRRRNRSAFLSGVRAGDYLPSRSLFLRTGAVSAGASIIFAVVLISVTCLAHADPNDLPAPPDPPSNSALMRPLPVITPHPSSWAPKYPFPYDQTRSSVTGGDINAMGEMCQWYNAEYVTLRDQIDRLQFNRVADNGVDFDYGINDVQQQVDIVAGNLDQSLAFLDPRVHALSQLPDYVGDLYFPVYGGQAFYRLWEQLANVDNGIKAHQPDWFTGPSVQKAKRWGSDIHHKHVCD